MVLKLSLNAELANPKLPICVLSCCTYQSTASSHSAFAPRFANTELLRALLRILLVPYALELSQLPQLSE